MGDCLRLKKSNCKNCYKCIRHCPVKAIRFTGNQATIVGNECILCGHCFVVCPQDAKEIRDETEKVKVLLNAKEQVIVSLAPSFIANYQNVGIKSMERALKKLGFFACEETAVGATIVKNEYERILKEDKPELLITSCCHSINLLIQKHFPKELAYLAKVYSPMQAHALDIKKRYPNSKIVFVGPCVAKKDEGEYYSGIVDAVLTFEELSNMLKDAGITLEEEEDFTEESKARLFPTNGGVLATLEPGIGDYEYISFDGVETCMAALEDIEKGGLRHCVIEMSSCIGSCIGGPVMEKYHKSPLHDLLEIREHAGKKDFVVPKVSKEELNKQIDYIGLKAPVPSEEEIKKILEQMGKLTAAQELNCGSCGYETCRAKAIAVYQGKAEINMCLPFLKERAESFYNAIINNAPDGIILLNDNLEIQQINTAARKLMNVRYITDVLGEPIINILDPEPFIRVKETGRSIKSQRKYLAEYERYVDWTIVYEKSYRIFICLTHDVTERVLAKEKKEEFTQQTIEVTDKVIDKQMRIVQEIASLLGETAAETKIALTKLKESMKDDE